MDAEVIEIPRSDSMLAALDRVVAVAEETDENAAFEAPVREFWHAFFAECAARGLCHKWSPLTLLQLLERALLADQSLSVDDRINYAAALWTIRQYIEFGRRERASLN
jgi:hypothetical protein